MDAAAITALGLIFTGLTGLFLKFVNDNSKSQSIRDEAFSKSLDLNTKAMQSVAKATEQSAKEAAERNGHLAELAIENKDSTLTAIAMIKEAVANQHVDFQVVDKQTVNNETVKHQRVK